MKMFSRQKRETYIVATEVVKVLPEKFDGFYEIKYPDTVQVWGEAAAKCLWQFTCYQPCEMQMRVRKFTVLKMYKTTRHNDKNT